MLKISRDDIESEKLTQFKPHERFIKLDIQVYMELIGAWENVNKPQIALINAINNPKYRFICAALSRRLGKTYIANIIGQLVSLVPNSHVLIVSPNYSLSSISFELQRKFIKDFKLETEKNSTKDRIIELANGSTVRMGSLSTVDSCVGRSYSLIIFDEAALGDGRSAWDVALRPTLDRLGSKALFISTPRGRNNWFCEFFERGFSSLYPEWASISADYHENPRMSEADILEARRSMPKAEFEQEYMASFNVFQGQIYALPESSIIDFSICERQESFGGLDPGYRDPTAYVVIIYDMNNDRFVIVDEYLESEAVTNKHAAAIGELNMKYGVDLVFIDPAAAQFAADLAYNYEITTTRARKDILPGIAYVQNLLETNRLFVDRRCRNTLAMFDQYRWKNTEGKVGQREEPVHDEYSHIADAVRYALYTYTV